VGRTLDTSEDARRRQIEALRAMTPAERLRLADCMSTEVRAIAESGIRSRRPAASDQEVAETLATRILGPELADAARRARSARRE
jgi:hypothetical protein